jgi:small subunit ribosomal protein S4e
MVKNHLSRFVAPKTWPISVKKTKWTVRPISGPHKLKSCLPIALILREMLKVTNNLRETKNILHRKLVKIDRKTINEYKYPVGILDVIEVENSPPKRLVLDEQGKFKLIDVKDTSLKPLKIINKKLLKNKKLQLNFSDGRNLIIDKDNYKVNDTVIFDLEKKKITKTLKFEKGAKVYLIGGKHAGLIGTLNETQVTSSKTKQEKITFDYEKKTYETLREYAYVVEENMVK